ncbi:hypothetical protein [Bacillus thuringiensis]|uniref:hypothetical protein n=1 Tax=Bacillus thuringiensis TaxID=1428 RepID=UPI00159BCB5F|nr:hypothetical protein [Bacillus thuringiensis]
MGDVDVNAEIFTNVVAKRNRNVSVKNVIVKQNRNAIVGVTSYVLFFGGNYNPS